MHETQAINLQRYATTSLYHYILLITMLLGFALIPISAIAYTLAAIRTMSAIWVVECALPREYKPIWQNIYQKMGVSAFYRCAAWSLEAIFTYQDMAGKVKALIFKKDWQFKLVCCVFLIALPNDMFIMLQYLACYTMSLLVYQLSSIFADKGIRPLIEQSMPFSPSRDQGQNLNRLSKTQMKLITMLLMSSLMSFPYYPVVVIFLFAPMLAPWIANSVHSLVRKSFEMAFPDGVLKKDYHACLILAALMTLLINYKYEYNIINHVLTFYSSILIGEIGRLFYTGENQNDIHQHGVDVIETMYHPELIMSFWMTTMFYEVTIPLINIPHLLFIAMGLSLGVVTDYQYYFDWVRARFQVEKESPDPVQREIFKEYEVSPQRDCHQTPVQAPGNVPLGLASH